MCVCVQCGLCTVCVKVSVSALDMGYTGTFYTSPYMHIRVFYMFEMNTSLHFS